MLQSVRRHLAVFLAAMLGVVVGSVGPSVARATYDAANAHKVDGKHAVSSGASAKKRAGKLVAANRHGRAPDSERFKGFTHAQFRTQPLTIQAAFVSGSAIRFGNGVSLPAAGTSTLVIGFVVPPDHTPTDSLFIDLIYGEPGLSACDWYVFAAGLVGPQSPGDSFKNAGWKALPNTEYDGPVHATAGFDGELQVFESPFQFTPGKVVQFQLTRAGDRPDDTCGPVAVYGLQLRY